MNSPSKDVAILLDAQGIGVLSGQGQWGVYSYREPPKPDDSITVYDTGGSDEIAEPDNDLFHPTVQVRIRAHSYDAAYAKQIEVRNYLLDDLVQTIINADTRVVGFWAETGIVSIGVDENNRHRLVANYRLQRERF